MSIDENIEYVGLQRGAPQFWTVRRLGDRLFWRLGEYFKISLTRLQSHSELVVHTMLCIIMVA